MTYEIICYKSNGEADYYYPTFRKLTFKKARELKASGKYEMVIVQLINEEEILDEWTI